MIDIHRTEDEQVEAIKKWWSENGTAVITGVILGVLILAGLRYWYSYQDQQAQTASVIYVEFTDALKKENEEAINKSADLLSQEYSSTPYATLAAFNQATFYVNKGNIEKALEIYRWAEQNAPHDALKHIARVRLARILIESGKANEALTLLQNETSEAFSGAYEELKADAYHQLGNIEKAREHYNLALNNADSQQKILVEMKLYNLPKTNSTNSKNSDISTTTEKPE